MRPEDSTESAWFTELPDQSLSLCWPFFFKCFKGAWVSRRITPFQSVRVLRVIFPRMVIWKVRKSYTDWCEEQPGSRITVLPSSMPPPLSPLPAYLPVLSPPLSNPLLLSFLFLLQSGHRVEFKEFPCKISLPRNASWYINVKCSLF